MPSCRAPAQPVVPPPLAIAKTLYRPSVRVTTNGRNASARSDGYGSASGSDSLFTKTAPISDGAAAASASVLNGRLTGIIHTRTLAVFLRPTAYARPSSST